jgi:hypothetical protein
VHREELRTALHFSYTVVYKLAINLLLVSIVTTYGPGQRSRYSDSLRAGRSWNLIPVDGELFRTRPDRPWGPPILLYNEYRVFPGGKAAGAWS